MAVRLWRLLRTSYVMFHIVAPLFEIEEYIYRTDRKNYEDMIKDHIVIIDAIYEMFYSNCVIIECLNDDGVLIDICRIIIEYSLYPLPINGTIEDIERVITYFDTDCLS